MSCDCSVSTRPAAFPCTAACRPRGRHHYIVQVRTLVAEPSAQGRAPAEVTRVLAAPDSPHLAAGHADGSIRIWNLDTGDCEVCYCNTRLHLACTCMVLYCCSPCATKWEVCCSTCPQLHGTCMVFCCCPTCMARACYAAAAQHAWALACCAAAAPHGRVFLVGGGLDVPCMAHR